MGSGDESEKALVRRLSVCLDVLCCICIVMMIPGSKALIA